VTTKFAFVGFRHPHINDMHSRCLQRDDTEVVACCEEDAAAREALAVKGNVRITHSSFSKMLSEVPCDVIAVGDYYQKRGSLLIEALEADRHVIGDKPLCTSLAELDRIEELAREKNRVVGCMLDMRDSAIFLGLRKLIRKGEIGKIHTITFGGQHALNFGVRPGWYFEPGKHGGTLNDIAIHGVDAIPWMTGQKIQRINAARCWNSRLPDLPQFKECAQAMFELSGGCGVICDVSYVSPDSGGFTLPLYWRFTFWGEEGVLEAGYASQAITLYKNGERTAVILNPPEGRPGGYLESFLQEVAGETEGLHLTSSEALQAARTTLQIQQAADDGLCHVEV